MASIFESFIGSPAVELQFSARGFVSLMLRFEAALAQAQGSAGTIPAEAAQAISEVCSTALEKGWLEPDHIARASVSSGTVAVPLVQTLRQLVSQHYPQAAAFVHVGCTSQDVIDTALVLGIGQVLELIQADLRRITQALRLHAANFQDTPVLARTLMQPASITSVGMKCTQWLLPLERCAERLHALAGPALVVQLGGAVGNRAQLGAHAEKIVGLVAKSLGLRAGASWHTQRDQLGRLASELALISAALAKIGADLLMFGQFEVGEIREPAGPGRGVSSAMPHKQNPVASVLTQAAHLQVAGLLGSLTQAMVHTHERAAGQWQAELLIWPRLLAAVHCSSTAMADTIPGLVFDPERMAKNIADLRISVDSDTAAQWFDERLASSAGETAMQLLAASGPEA